MQETTISRSYSFEAAHFLPNVPDGHKCKKMHGHSYVISVRVRGVSDPHTGFVIDFADLDALVNPMIKELDHQVINDFIENPTAERIVSWFLDRLMPKLTPIKNLYIVAVRVNETVKAYAQEIRDIH